MLIKKRLIDKPERRTPNASSSRPLCVLLALMLAPAIAVPVLAVEPILDEYQVKAAFLFNFAKFVEWPAAAFKNAAEPISICVFGGNPFGSLLEDAVKGKTVGGRGFVVREVSNSQQTANCHVLFVNASGRKRVPTRALLIGLKTGNILTVGESDDFIANGGVINFKLKDARVRIEIDAEAAEQANFRISSKLRSLAENARK